MLQTRFLSTPLILVSVLAISTVSKAETFVGITGGYQLQSIGTGMEAQEDLGYTGPTPNRVPATASDIIFDQTPTLGLKLGHYFESTSGFGIEFEGQYSRPNFKRQDVTINLTNANFNGHSSFTEDQLEANFHMLTGSVNALYRFEAIDSMNNIRPYIGAGPSVYAVAIDGSGDSCKIIAPVSEARDYCEGGDMKSSGVGFGFNVKAGVEMAIDDHWSLDAEYKLSYGKMDIDWFRSFSDIKIDHISQNISAGLRYKF